MVHRVSRALQWITSTAAILVVALAYSAQAAPTPTPAPSVSPAATAQPRGIELHGGLNAVFLSQGSSGPGLQPVEGPAFAQGAPAAPVSPYDAFSAAPMVPGNVQQNQVTIDALWHLHGNGSMGATMGFESLLGDRTNAAYWGEPLQPQDNAHLGSSATGFSIVFPTHPGTDDNSGVRFGLTQVRATLLRGNLALKSGWFTLSQNLGCVFTTIPTTSALPSLLLKTPESLNPNSPGLDAWTPSQSTLPMRGFDATFNAGAVTIEAADAQLPSLPGTPARVVSLSAASFDGNGHGYMAQWIHAHSAGDALSTTTGFGAALQIVPTDQGMFAVSNLYGQEETVAGARVVEPIGLGIDATFEYSHSGYRADDLGKPGPAGGSWTHGALSRALGAGTAAVHYYRFEPTFATMVLPYGVPENIWSVAYSWPGPWLKSTYQLVDSTTLGVNRQGPLYSYSFDNKSVTGNASFSNFREIVPFTTANFGGLGFIDGFFLVQGNPAEAKFGRFRRTSIYLGKHLHNGELGFDFVDDGLHRDFAADAPSDAVSFDAPQYVVSLTRKAGANAVGVAGYAYYGMRGSWADGAATNVDYGMRTIFAGGQFAERSGNAWMITVRRSRLSGAPYFGALGLLHYGSPDFSATTLFVEQRFRL